MVLRPNALKVAISGIQNAIKTKFLNGISWNLLNTFFRDYSSTICRGFENLEILGEVLQK